MDSFDSSPPTSESKPQKARDEQSVNQEEVTLLQEAVMQYELAGEPPISVSEMDEKDRDRSVELAREILEKLRIQIGSDMISHGLNDLPYDTNELISDINELTDLFDYYISTARAMDETFMHDPHILAAVGAADALTYQMLKAAMQEAVDRDWQEEALQIKAHMQALSNAAKKPKENNFGKLINKMELGIQKAQARLEAMGAKETFGQSGRGLADAMSIGAHNSTQKQDKLTQASHFNDEYTKHLMARKQARMAIVRQLQAQRAAQRNQKNQQMAMPRGREAQAEAPHANPIEQLLSPQQIEQMRSAMATTLGVAPVGVGVKDTIKQVKNSQTQRQIVRQQIEQSKRGTLDRQEIQGNQNTQSNKPPHKPQKGGRGV